MEATSVRFGIPAIALLLAGLFVAGVAHAEARLGTEAQLRARRIVMAALGAVLYLGLIAAVSLSGVLGRLELRPPPLPLLAMGALSVSLFVALSALGARLARGLPLWALVGYQAFRLPLELLMHRAANDGLMPSVMSWNGYNFDIVSGISGLLLGVTLYLRTVPRWLVVAWNLLGSVLLAVITAVAMAATPIFRAFGDQQVNLWVTRFPYTWMIVMVAAALFGHVILARRLRSERVRGSNRQGGDGDVVLLE
jgi:hypothetical protein